MNFDDPKNTLTETAKVTAKGPRKSGMTFGGMTMCFDDFPLRPDEPCWIRQVNNDDGTVETYYSRQSDTDLAKVDWIRLT